MLPNALNSAYTNAGITFTPYFNERGDLLYINVNGTATGAAYYDLYNNTNKRLIEDTTSQYTFTLVNNVMIKQIYERIDSSWRNTYTYSSNTAYTPSEGSTGQLFRILVNSGTTLNNEKIYPMVYKGSYDSSKTYEPFTNGASPNPSYEQPIKSCGDNVNLLPNTATSQTKNGIEFTVYNDGTVKANGTSTGYAIITIANIQLPKGNYILSGCPKGGGNLTFLLRTQNGVNVPDVYDLGSGVNIPVTENSGSADIKLQISPNVTVNNLIFKPKIEKGTQPTPYSPYGMGSITEKIVNKNFFDYTVSPVYSGGTKLNVLDTGIRAISIVNSSTNANNACRIVVLDIKSFIGKPIILSAHAKSSSTNKGFMYLRLCKQNGDFSNAYNTIVSSETLDGDLSISYTIPSGIGDYHYLMVALYSTRNSPVAIDDYVDYTNLQLELGSSVTSYQHFEKQTYSIYTQQPFRSIGDVRDVFFKNTVDSPYYDENLTLNGWYERHEITRKILNGTETWAVNGNVFYSFITDKIKTKSTVLSNYFIYANKDWQNLNNYELTTQANNNAIFIKNNDFTTVADFKTWLSTHNTELIYQSEEPTNLQCTQSQIDILENIPSTFAGQTNVFSIDEVKAYLEVAGLLDLNTLVNN